MIQVLRDCVRRALHMMVQMSSIPEDELFKICLDFWHYLCIDIQSNPRNSRDQAHIVGMDFYGVLNGSYMT